MEADWEGPFVAEGEDLRQIYRGLDQHLIFILFDVPYATPTRGLVEVPFLGGTAQFPAGVYRIAKKMEALIAPCWIGTSGEGPAVTEFQPLIDPHDHDEQSLLSLLAGQVGIADQGEPRHLVELDCDATFSATADRPLLIGSRPADLRLRRCH
jgi:lauroyl/myristoyl acyltransferase